jgi:hypothetical protein
MAWNPSPEVAAARDIGNRFGFEQVIVVMLDDKGRMMTVTYGKTRVLCSCAEALGNVASAAIEQHIEHLTTVSSKVRGCADAMAPDEAQGVP